jgi:hypothetical protein
MTARETGKQRASRIPLDYFKHPDGIVRVKGILTGIALVAAAAWCASGLLTGDQGQVRYSHGPLAAVHATWDADCDTCHVPFSPISGGNLLSSVVAKPLPADSRCEACHAGPLHHRNQKPEEVASCGSCHRDHQGRDVSLVHMADSHCTNCHADLPKHTIDGKTAFHPNVSKFAPGAHPEFKMRGENQRGKLKFNHTLHLTAGLNVSWQLKNIRDPSERDRYRKPQQPDTGLVQLDCASCHQLDGDGHYFQPINYDNQCRACHPLTFDARLPGVSIPHRLQPAEVRAFLWGAYVERAVQDPATQQRLLRPLPVREVREEEDKVRQAVGGQVTTAESFLYKQVLTEKELYIYSGKTTCGECHHYESKPGQRLPERIVPPAIPSVWQSHARFSHRAHRAMNCQECHARTNQSTTADDVLLPGIADCFKCHAPLHRGADGSVQGGARHHCTECHRYHHGEAPHLGLGSAARDARAPGTIEEFLSGALLKKRPATGK